MPDGLNHRAFSSGDVLLSHGLSPYYHRGCSVSLPCSEWERVGQGNCSIFQLTKVGNPTMLLMPMTKSKQNPRLTVVDRYDVAADAKKRINLRNAKTKYFHVKALSNGAYLLEPRVLVPLEAISARSMRMLDKSAANLKKGIASAPI